jgi:Bacterial Ig-like domain (group 3)
VSSGWSDSNNWVGATAPADNASSLALTFPDLGSCSPPAVCSQSNNDRVGLGLSSLDFTGTPFDSYQLGGNAVTLGSGGISSTSAATLSLPLQLVGATQTWTIDGGDLNLASSVTGSSALTVDLSDTPSPQDATGTLTVTGDTEVGPMTLATSPGSVIGLVELTAGSSTSASLNGTNGNPVSVTGPTQLIASGPGSNQIGALSLGSNGLVHLGVPAGVGLPAVPTANLQVKGGVTFSSSSGFGDTIDSTGLTAGVDYGELTATGDVALNNAGFSVAEAGGGCPADSDIGKSFPLLSTPGTISGTFAGASDSELVSVGFGITCTTMMQMHYSPHEIYGTIVKTAGTSSSAVVSATPNPAVAGQSVTYSATDSGGSGAPGGSVIFAATGVGTLCTAELVGGSGSCTSSAAPAGVDSIGAYYSGDATYAGWTNGLHLTVNNPTPPTPPAPPTPPPPAPHGYWLVGSDGGIFTFGSSQFYGSTGNLKLQRPVVGITPTADRNGYWLVGSDGGVFAYGDAGFVGAIPGLGLHPAGSGLPNSLAAPIVGIVPSHDGGGYFMVASDGGVFAFGDAHFAGSCPGIGGCSGSAVDVMPDASGNGYWIVTSSGNVYGFGDAAYYGSPGHGTVTSAVATPDGKGYWVLLSNGQVFAYGGAANLGSPPPGGFNAFDPANAIFATSDGGGYWVSSALGAVDTFGDAPNDGSMAGSHLNGSIVAGNGY